MNEIVTNRRTFFTGMAAVIAAPYVMRKSGILMPIKSILKPQLFRITEVSQDGKNWFALAYLNLKLGLSPNYHGNFPTILDYANNKFNYHRVVFAKGWTP